MNQSTNKYQVIIIQPGGFNVVVVRGQLGHSDQSAAPQPHYASSCTALCVLSIMTSIHFSVYFIPTELHYYPKPVKNTLANYKVVN